MEAFLHDHVVSLISLLSSEEIEMITKVNGTRHELILEGPISEKTAIFDYNISQATEVDINMEKVTFINSIGVKNWINWAINLSPRCRVSLRKCPYVIVNQVNIVQGFLPHNAKIESFIAPYLCDQCGLEAHILTERGKDYEYATETHPKFARVMTNLPCTKCKGIMEPDFIVEKTFSFLSPKK